MVKKKFKIFICLCVSGLLLLNIDQLKAQPGLNFSSFKSFLPVVNSPDFQSIKSKTPKLEIRNQQNNEVSSLLYKRSQTVQYQAHLAFFCKIEEQIAKSSKIPVKFRLGDQNYVDYLEQKGSAKVLQKVPR